MKQLLFCALALLSLSACREDPDLGELSTDFLVFTTHDTSANFQGFSTYYMPDSVMVIGDSKDPTYWTGTQASEILDAYQTQMTTCGYTRTTDKASADLGLQISYVQSVAYFTNYYSPYWWNGYPGYWDPSYWGPWGGWYYPYAVVYSYSIGSLLTEMVNLNSSTSGTKKLTVVWNSFLSGLLSNSDTFNTTLTVRAIDQSFTQSPYLNH
ncbi:MAG: DUF4136 domain-containing protein [Alistipes sp.]|nr:DUF4136 domain-containing protein [Alistipes sp.]